MLMLTLYALLCENKNASDKMLNPWTSDSKSNTLLSGLTWHLLVRLRL